MRVAIPGSVKIFLQLSRAQILSAQDALLKDIN